MDIEKYKKVYDQYFNLANKIAFKVLGDYYLSGDVAQEVFVEMFLKKEGLDSERIKYWIVLNVNRRAIDQLRKAYYHHEQGMGVDESYYENAYADDSSTFDSVTPEEVAMRKERVNAQKSALEMLRDYNPGWYDILLRCFADGESYQSLATAYGVKVETLRVQVHRARTWLDKTVYELYGEEF